MSRYLALIACLALIHTPALALEASEGWMRALPPGQPTVAAYLSLKNSGPDAVYMVAAYSPAAERVEIHQSAQVDGMWRMRRLDRLAIPAGETVMLAPGETHLMMTGLKRSLREGDQVTVTLEFDTGEALTASILVKPPGAGHQHRH